MLSSLALSLTLWVVAAEPVPIPADGATAPMADGNVAGAPGAALTPHGYQPGGYSGMDGYGSGAGYYGSSGAFDGSECFYDNGCCENRTCCCDWWCPHCTMSQRIEYWPSEHGYYYFRPYHMSHVVQQREIARSWGEDPRNPYDHKVFERVYAALQAERQALANGPEIRETRVRRKRARSNELRAISPAVYSTNR
jgi:hypothetical protein